MAQETVVNRSQPEFTTGGLILRLLFALGVVAITYNPTGYSYFEWAKDALVAKTLGPLHAVGGVALLGAWVLLISATSRSLGALGVILVAAFFASLVWLLIDRDLVEAQSFQAIAWIGVIVVGLILAIGVSWSHIRKRITGQADVDEIDSR
ncbi:MAG: hypothetical protein JNM50_00640 [Chromatiales bacterium]|nr:hypothetical protein [Chromatiales bacterium]